MVGRGRRWSRQRHGVVGSLFMRSSGRLTQPHDGIASMMGARVLVSPAVCLARRTRQPLCAAFWFAAPLRPASYTCPVGVGCIERRVPGAWDASRLVASVLRAASAVFPIKLSSLLSSRVSTSTAFGALEAATRGRDLLKLAHCRTDSSPVRPARPPIWKADSRDTPPSFWALALHGSGWDAPWDYRGIPPPKDQSWGPDSIVLRLGPGVN